MSLLSTKTCLDFLSDLYRKDTDIVCLIRREPKETTKDLVGDIIKSVERSKTYRLSRRGTHSLTPESILFMGFSFRRFESPPGRVWKYEVDNSYK